MKSKVYVFSDSVLCVGGNGGNILLRQALVKLIVSRITSQVRSIVNSTISQESWSNSYGVKTWDEQLFNFSSYIQEMLAEEGVTPSQLKPRVYNDVNWWQNQKEDVRRQNAIQVSSYAKDFDPRRWSYLGRRIKMVRQIDRQAIGESELSSGD